LKEFSRALRGINQNETETYGGMDELISAPGGSFTTEENKKENELRGAPTPSRICRKVFTKKDLT
jgi:hypothetical protein